MKKCYQCEQQKTETEFPSTGRKCKVCKAFNLREYRKNNKQHVLSRSKIWRSQNKDKINEQKRASYLRHSDKIKKKNNNYYHQNAEKRKTWQKQYQIDKETENVASWLAKCLKHSIAGDKKYKRNNNIKIAFLIKLCKNQNGKCALSGVEMTHQRGDLFAISIDRIDSSIGHVEDNIQLVCSGLNRAKREYSNQKTLDFVKAIKNQSYSFKEFIGFNYPESTKLYTPHKRAIFKEDMLKPLFNKSFVPPAYKLQELINDYYRIEDYNLNDYYKNGKWRSHKPENKPWAGKKLVWHFHQHLWKVRTQKKPLIGEVWNEGKIFNRCLTNLVEGQTKISLERIIREFVFAGVGVPSQIHVGFARAVYQYFECKPGDIVYDPFAGWGGRLLAATSMGLNYEAHELSKPTLDGLNNMVKLCVDNAVWTKGTGVILKNLDSLEFTRNAKLMFTSPPFGSEEYIGADHNVDLNKLLEITKNIPTRVLHVNKELLKNMSPTRVIEIAAKNSVGLNSSKEFLAVYE